MEFENKIASWQTGKTGKLSCSFVSTMRTLDTILHGMLWQVLEKLGVCGTTPGCHRSLYAHDTAALQSLRGLSVVLTCLKGVKQGYSLNPTLLKIICEWAGEAPAGDH